VVLENLREADEVRGAVEAAQDRKARDLVVLDMRQVTLVADYFLLCTGGSRLHVQAIADSVEERLGRARGREGYAEGRWVCLDYGALVVHVFTDEARAYYDLDRLWGDAPRVLDAEEAHAV
jgi:ribosome-associated protein